VLDVNGDAFELVELAPGVTREDVVARTDAAVVSRSEGPDSLR